jgi:hypothetical protein
MLSKTQPGLPFQLGAFLDEPDPRIDHDNGQGDALQHGGDRRGTQQHMEPGIAELKQ